MRQVAISVAMVAAVVGMWLGVIAFINYGTALLPGPDVHRELGLAMVIGLAFVAGLAWRAR